MKTAYAFIASIALALLFGSCASMPPVTDQKATLTLMDQSSLKSATLGYSFNDNPYLEPSKVWGKVDEFVVLKLDLELPTSMKVEMDVSVLGSDGGAVAEFKDHDVMEYYWSNWIATKDQIADRNQMLFRTYIPGLSFMGREGRHSYYLVCLGPKYPLPRPYTVEARVSLDGAIAAELTQTLEPLPTKAKK
jgi:hypothetical protein